MRSHVSLCRLTSSSAAREGRRLTHHKSRRGCSEILSFLFFYTVATYHRKIEMLRSNTPSLIHVEASFVNSGSNVEGCTE